MTALVFPTLHRYPDWAACVEEFHGSYPHGSGLPEAPPLDSSPAAYATSVERAFAFADTHSPAPDGWQHGDYLWITDGQELLGFLRFTYELNDSLLARGGHVGYSIRPSRRRQGHASRALGLAIERARARGIARVLVTCEESNLASARVIESQGGVRENALEGLSRYWIVPPPAAPR